MLIASLRRELDLNVTIKQLILLSLADEARWAIKNKSIKRGPKCSLRSALTPVYGRGGLREQSQNETNDINHLLRIRRNWLDL